MNFHACSTHDFMRIGNHDHNEKTKSSHEKHGFSDTLFFNSMEVLDGDSFFLRHHTLFHLEMCVKAFKLNLTRVNYLRLALTIDEEFKRLKKHRKTYRCKYANSFCGHSHRPR